MFNEDSDKVPTASTAEAQFGAEIKNELRKAYKKNKTPDGEPKVHEAAYIHCDENEDGIPEIPEGSSPSETAAVIGYISARRIDMIDDVIREHTQPGEKRLAHLFVGKIALQNGDS